MAERASDLGASERVLVEASISFGIVDLRSLAIRELRALDSVKEFEGKPEALHRRKRL